MSSPTQHGLSPSEVAALVEVSFGAGVGVAECAELAGGGFATVWRVRLGDGRQAVLKVAPRPDVGLLRYERGLIAAEARYFRLVHTHAPDVPVPDVLYHGTDRRVFDSEWLFTSYLPGTALPDLRRSGTDDATVRSELGAAVGRIHAINGPRFGYSGQRAHASTWYAAFVQMVDDLLADAGSWDVELPRPPRSIRQLVARHADVLAAVDRPTLVHFDLWDGNVLASTGANGVAHLTGLVDGERYLFGDHLIDFVSPALFRRIEEEPEHPFLHGYAEATGTRLVFDASTRRRLALYRMHLLLVMSVEMPSRGMTGEPHAARRQRVNQLLAEELAELNRPQ